MKLLIYGASGLAKEVYDIVVRNTPDKYEKIYFIDDYVEESSFYLSETIRFDSLRERLAGEISNFEGIVAVGEPSDRQILQNKLEEMGISITEVVDRTAIISPTAQIGKGCIICERSVIHADVNIGQGALLQPYSAIGHSSSIGSYSVVSSGCVICGDVCVGDRTYMGVNSAVKEKLSIGKDVIVAMGATVFSNIEDGNTVVGNPARITRGNNQHRVF